MNGAKVDAAVDAFGPELGHIRREFGQTRHACEWTEQGFGKLLPERVAGCLPVIASRLPRGFRQRSGCTAGERGEIGSGRGEIAQRRRAGAHAGQQPAQLGSVFCDLASCQALCPFRCASACEL